MKRGFTILELLVASMLLGMLVTILTMIFNQSSIAWRIGKQGVSDLGDARYTIGFVREMSDNAFVYNNQCYRNIGLWDRSGALRSRACSSAISPLDSQDPQGSTLSENTRKFFALPEATSASAVQQLNFRDLKSKHVGSGSSRASFKSLFVNVKSGGPKNDVKDYQAIWSAPDDPNNW